MLCPPNVLLHHCQPCPRFPALWPSCLPCLAATTSMDTTCWWSEYELAVRARMKFWGKSDHNYCLAWRMGIEPALGKPEKPAAHSFNEILLQLLPPRGFIRWDYWTLALVSYFHAARHLPCAPNNQPFVMNTPLTERKKYLNVPHIQQVFS